ncbi:MAG: J domain-containing protein [Verrucomicrobia bacterium]|nr:J domain-containing protein [Verrucomicrobiota bacterium]
MRTHYENLHVTEDAPDEVIRASYRALSLKHHPDTAGDKPQSQWKMQRINDSYAVLSDTQKKAAYDGELRRQRNPRQAQSAPPLPVRQPAKRQPIVARRGLPQRPPGWMPAGVGWLSDARLVVPLMIIIWLIVWWKIQK